MLEDGFKLMLIMAIEKVSMLPLHILDFHCLGQFVTNTVGYR